MEIKTSLGLMAVCLYPVKKAALIGKLLEPSTDSRWSRAPAAASSGVRSDMGLALQTLPPSVCIYICMSMSMYVRKYILCIDKTTRLTCIKITMEISSNPRIVIA